jgi:arginyl-tRNA--protein-N-Asp/Glu arginylyltransferase
MELGHRMALEHHMALGHRMALGLRMELGRRMALEHRMELGHRMALVHRKAYLRMGHRIHNNHYHRIHCSSLPSSTSVSILANHYNHMPRVGNRCRQRNRKHWHCKKTSTLAR